VGQGKASLGTLSTAVSSQQPLRGGRESTVHRRGCYAGLEPDFTECTSGELFHSSGGHCTLHQIYKYINLHNAQESAIASGRNNPLDVSAKIRQAGFQPI
jgi:hypothetical protein